MDPRLTTWRRELEAVERTVDGDDRCRQRLESFRQKLASAENKSLWIRQQGPAATAETLVEFERLLQEVERAWRVLRRSLRSSGVSTTRSA